jgi:hypothetical protein
MFSHIVLKQFVASTALTIGFIGGNAKTVPIGPFVMMITLLTLDNEGSLANPAFRQQ